MAEQERHPELLQWAVENGAPAPSSPPPTFGSV